MKTKHARRSGNKNNASRWYALLALVGLLTMLLWPTAAAAVPLSDEQELKQAWEYAAEMGVYRYRTNAIQTTHPTLMLVNVGRSSSTKRMTVAGTMDRPNDTMQLTMNGLRGRQTVELKVEQGVSYGRLNPQAEWTRSKTKATFSPLAATRWAI